MSFKDFKFSQLQSNEGISFGSVRMIQHGSSKAYGLCGAGYKCTGGGGMCGAGYKCTGGGGMCGAGHQCGGS